MISGHAGIGKSALPAHVKRRAKEAGSQIISAVGVESEAELAFSGLHQLMEPILGLTDRLPKPRRLALEAAFGITDARVPNRFHVGLAAHQLITEAASSRPLIIVVDDAHWIDKSSLDVLSFLSRRLETEPIALFATLREGYSISLGEEVLPRLRVERLSADAAAQLLDRHAPELHPIRRAGLLAEAAGNPLASRLLCSRPSARATRSRWTRRGCRGSALSGSALTRRLSCSTGTHRSCTRSGVPACSPRRLGTRWRSLSSASRLARPTARITSSRRPRIPNPIQPGAT